MKILFLARRYHPAIGGVETHLHHVVKELKTRHQITLVTEQFNDQLPLFEKREGITVYRLPFGREAGKWQVWSWLMAHWWLLLRADVIHVHDVFFWVLPFRFLFFWKKFYITFHGYEAPGPLTPKQIFWHQYAAMLTRKNLCIGEFHQKWYGVKPDAVSFGGAEKVILNEVSKSKQKKFVFVGRLADDTGIREYLQACAQLPAKTQYTFDVVGDGTLLQELKTFSRTHHLPVHFHGFQDDVIPFISSANVMCVSQYLSMLQALAYGKPVIAYADTPIKTDYLRLTPFAKWITIAESVSDLVVALQKETKLVPAAQKWAQAQTWKKVADTYEKMWKDDK